MYVFLQYPDGLVDGSLYRTQLIGDFSCDIA